MEYLAWLVAPKKGEFVAIFLQNAIDAARGAGGSLPQFQELQPLPEEPPGITWTLQRKQA